LKEIKNLFFNTEPTLFREKSISFAGKFIFTFNTNKNSFMKKLILLFLALGMAASSWAYDFTDGGIYYNITDATNKTVEVTSARPGMATATYTGLITIPSSATNSTSGTTYTVTAIGDGAFSSCESLKTVTLPTSITSIGISSFCYCTALKSLTIPISVKSIGYGAFMNCDSITSLSIPNSVTTIGEYAFSMSRQLQTISISESVKSIGSMAFYLCSSLTNINVEASNTNFSSIDGVLFNKAQTKLMAYPEGRTGAYTVPSSVTAIGNEAFMYNLHLSSISLPTGLTSIGDSAFCCCLDLKSITIPNTVTYIGSCSFFYSNLKTITIPNSVLTINNAAFEGCDSLTTVTIPASVTYIGNLAFDCINLSNIYVLNTTPSAIKLPADTAVFDGVNKTTCVLHVPAGSKSLYQAANQWKDFSIITENTSGLYTASASQSKIMVINGNVLVEGANAGTSITIYNLQGTAIYSGKTSGETQSIALPNRGVYIVLLGGKSVKVIY
jgi:hypothetical protein